MTDRERLKKIFEEASCSHPMDAGELLNFIREMEKELPEVAEQTHNYTVVNWTWTYDKVQDCANAYAKMGWRLVSMHEYILIFERPVGVSHPDDTM